MRTVALVPIKMNNERTPGKNTKKFDDGTPLLTYFLKKFVQIEDIDEIYVFCSNPQIKKYIPDGVNYLERPAFLDTSETLFQDIFSEFIRRIDSDIYVLAHCTSPFIKLDHYRECVRAVQSGEFDSAFTGEKLQKLLWKNNKPLNFDPQNIPRTQDLEPIYNEVPAMYAFKKDVFVTTKRRVGRNPYIVDITGIECIDIDYPEDFEIANAVYMQLVDK